MRVVSRSSYLFEVLDVGPPRMHVQVVWSRPEQSGHAAVRLRAAVVCRVPLERSRHAAHTPGRLYHMPLPGRPDQHRPAAARACA
jgi:hypothetical protein